jgi:hypothetical protein
MIGWLMMIDGRCPKWDIGWLMMIDGRCAKCYGRNAMCG